MRDFVQETGVKRVKNLRKSVASLASLISPGKPGKKMQVSVVPVSSNLGLCMKG